MTNERKKTPHALECFDRESAIGLITRRAASLSQLSEELKGCLPHGAKSYTRVANYKQGILLIETSNKKAMLDISLNREKILKIMGKKIPNLKDISISVNENIASSNVVLPEKGVTPEGADMLSAIAQMFDGDLKDSLLRLASHKTKS